MKDPTTPARFRLHPAINTLLASLRTGDPKIHNGLGLWPVFADCRPEPTCLTLVEALSLPGFKITEASEGGSVPSLRVINETTQHVLLFDGEELKGAKQNRILNTTILIAAGTSLDVPVTLLRLAQGLERWQDVLRLLREHPEELPAREFAPLKCLAHHELKRWLPAIRAAKEGGIRHGFCGSEGCAFRHPPSCQSISSFVACHPHANAHHFYGHLSQQGSP